MTRTSGRRRARSSRLCCVAECDYYWIDEPTALNLLEAFLPSRVTATMQTTAMRATRRAYSTRLAPRSLLAAKRARMYGATVPCQYEMRSTDCSLVSAAPSADSSSIGVWERGWIGRTAHCREPPQGSIEPNGSHLHR